MRAQTPFDYVRVQFTFFRCKEWLDEIQFQYKSVEDLNKLQNALVVCSKHFQPHNGGMKLIVEKKHISLEVTNSGKF